eukprot:scaffold144404_cov26-Tisochrysis_lutea.AAC.6
MSARTKSASEASTFASVLTAARGSATAFMAPACPPAPSARRRKCGAAEAPSKAAPAWPAPTSSAASACSSRAALERKTDMKKAWALSRTRSERTLRSKSNIADHKYRRDGRSSPAGERSSFNR